MAWDLGLEDKGCRIQKGSGTCRVVHKNHHSKDPQKLLSEP